MGWNGSGNNDAGRATSTKSPRVRRTTTPRSQGTPPPSKWRGLIALLVIVLGGIAAWIALRPVATETEESAPAKAKKIAEVEPQIAPDPVEVEEPVEKTKPKAYGDMSRDEQLAYFRNRYGDNIPDNLKATVYFLEHPPKYSYHPARSRVNMFKRRSDRKIASVLLIKPGEHMIQPPSFDERFDADFAEALKEDIEMSDDDTPEDRELKEAVLEVRTELAELQKKGENPSSVMQNEINSLAGLGRYKQDLYKQLTEIRKDASYSDGDVRDFVTAANEMLKSKGVSGFKMPNLLTRQMSLQRMAEKRSDKNNRD